MNEHNLADPDFEPTDEQLQELMKSVFANVKADHEASMIRLRLEIAQVSVVALERVSKMPIHEPGAAGCCRSERLTAGPHRSGLQFRFRLEVAIFKPF